MKKNIILLSLALFLAFNGAAKTPRTQPSPITIQEIQYDGKLSETEARFKLDLRGESTAPGEASLTLLQGDVAILPEKLPDSLRITREGTTYTLVTAHPGKFKFSLNLVAKIQRVEPWNQVSFVGPMATIAGVTAQAAGADMEVQLLGGTTLASAKTNGASQVKGFLSADQTVALRWESKVSGIAHKSLLTVESAIALRVTPTVVRYTSKFHYEIVQGSAARLTLSLPLAQSLTRLEGAQIRDWHTTAEGGEQTLSIEFIKPMEKSYDLALYSEEAVTSSNRPVIHPPQPLEVERESGSLSIAAEDTLIEPTDVSGLRQINTTGDAVASYQFNARPFTLALNLKPIEPEIAVTDRINARVEETRMLLTHHLAFKIEKSGVYALEIIAPANFAVASVRGDGVEDWNLRDGKIAVNFSSRLLGARALEVQLEQPLKHFPGTLAINPLRVTGAVKEVSQIGVSSSPGIRLHTDMASGMRQIPVDQLPDRTDELLAYTAEQPDWKLSIASEKMDARVIANVFNLATIGDGLVGASATIRYALVNQGVQEFKIRVPEHCKNVEFTGANIRRKEQSGDVWTIGLQDKVWGGYTLVVTYDFQFGGTNATLPIGGIHTVDVERETGSVAVTTAAGLQLLPKPAGDTLHRVDETELSAADRALITRDVVLAYQYTGDNYDLKVETKRYAEQRVLDAVVDRTQITSVLTKSGEMLSQASFMVKNNEKQFQRFQLPGDATLWSCYVNGQAAKPQRDADWLMVPLPREENRNQAFAVDIVYAQTNGTLGSVWGKPLSLSAPRTDIPNTYAEWQLFAPESLRLSDFGGSMTVGRGTTYHLFDAWEKFITFYVQVLREAGGKIFMILLLAGLLVGFVISAARRGLSGILTLLAVVAILAILAGMLLPALASAKAKAVRIKSVSNLKQVGLAARIFADEHGDRLPMSFEEMKTELNNDNITYDVKTGQRFTYIGGGMSTASLKADSVIAYSQIVDGGCEVLMADGSVQQLSAANFAVLSQRGLIQMASADQIATKQQRDAVVNAELPAAIPMQGAIGANEPLTATNFIQTANGGAVDKVPAAPVVAGIRSIHIELPQTGQPVSFTKVLNVRDEPLSIQARVMPMNTFLKLQMIWQTIAFLIGLAIWHSFWKRTPRNTFVLTIAMALIILSVGSLLIQWRALHDVLIIGFPVVMLAIICRLVWKYAARNFNSEMTPPPLPKTGLPPLAAAVMFILFLCLNTGSAAPLRQNKTELANPSIMSASYSGTVNDRVASVEATLQFSATTPGQTLPLFKDDVAVEQFTLKEGKAELVRNGSHVAILFTSRGTVIARVKLLVKTSGDVTKRRLAFAIPPALASEVSLTLEEAGAEVDIPGAISLQKSPEKEQTRVTAVMGAGDQLEMLWTPRVKRAAEIATTVFCQTTALVHFGGGVMSERTILDYQITQGEPGQARIKLPAGHRLLRVEGSEIRTWETREQNGSSILVVDLLKGVANSLRLTLETEKALGTLPADALVEIPHALDVKRENGFIALSSAEELGLTVATVNGLERVDAAELNRAKITETEKFASVFRFSNPTFELRVRIEATQPLIEAVVRNDFHVSADQAALTARIDYTIKRAGVFILKVALPDGYRVENVRGTDIQQQNEVKENSQRVLEVTLKKRTSDLFSLAIDLTRDFKELPKTLTLAGAHPLGATKLTGFIAVTTEPGLNLKTESFDGLTEIPAESLGNALTHSSSGGVLAYKFISASPASSSGWKLKVSTESIAAWVRAEIVDVFTLTETLVSGRAQLRYDIANAPVKELRVRVPAEFKNVELSGLNIRSRTLTGDVWRIELQNPVHGNYLLTVTWEAARNDKNHSVTLTGVSAEGVERETGLLAIFAKAPLQAVELNAADLQRVDAGDFPDWAGTPDNALALAYRYIRPGYKLSLDVRRFDEAAVLQALVDNAKLTSVIADDGQMMTEMSLFVRNNGRQFLEVTLPQGATVWSAFVGGQPVRPSLRDGRLLLPLAQSSSSSEATAVELTYIGTNQFPRTSGSIALASPQFDVPLKNARWELYLPPDFDYKKFSGTMTREIVPIAQNIAATSSFSSLDYSRMEQFKKMSEQVAVDREVSVARKQLAEGNMREANATFSQARRSLVNKSESKAVRQLEKDLQGVQTSNFINAQNEFQNRNSGLAFGGGRAMDTMDAAKVDAAAGEQWTKLQQAQEIQGAKIQPLRINLPVRGLYIAFNQILQTEGNKPMTIQLFASGTKVSSWPARLAGLIIGFLALWIFVALVSRLNTRRA